MNKHTRQNLGLTLLVFSLVVFWMVTFCAAAATHNLALYLASCFPLLIALFICIYKAIETLRTP